MAKCAPLLGILYTCNGDAGGQHDAWRVPSVLVMVRVVGLVCVACRGGRHQLATRNELEYVKEQVWNRAPRRENEEGVKKKKGGGRHLSGDERKAVSLLLRCYGVGLRCKGSRGKGTPGVALGLVQAGDKLADVDADGLGASV